MIDIHNCEVEGEVTETTIFEVSGTYESDSFSCKLELRFPPDDDLEDYEHLDGADLGPSGFDALEELLHEVYETETYQEALEEFEKIQAESDVILD